MKKVEIGKLGRRNETRYLPKVRSELLGAAVR